MASITFHITGDKKLLRALSDPFIIRLPLNRFLNKAVKEIEGEAKTLAPVDTGRYRASIKSHVTGFTKGVVGSNVVYAPIIEWGAKPGTYSPNVDDLTRWAARKGMTPARGVAFLIARAIRRRGLPAHRVFENALKNKQLALKIHLETMLRDVTNRFR